ncbi:hypothetical protein HYV11_02465 [Candidatus Dependentiae bacterium]|nr:hypothetical protein [Candidatus Dependentiae bacterium]
MMFDKILDSISAKNKGMIALVLGALVLIGAVGRLGILQDFFYIIMIIAGINLIVWGIRESEILGNSKKNK